MQSCVRSVHMPVSNSPFVHHMHAINFKSSSAVLLVLLFVLPVATGQLEEPTHSTVQRHNQGERDVEVMANGGVKIMRHVLAESKGEVMHVPQLQAWEGSMEVIHGIPVYGYHGALHADYGAGVSLLAAENDPVIWFIGLPENANDANTTSLCEHLPGKASCVMVGKPDKHGLPMVTLQATRAEFAEVLQKHPEAIFAEADYPIEKVPEFASDESGNLMERHTGTLPWGLDRIDQRDVTGDSNYVPVAKGGLGVHVYVFDTGVRTTHAEFNDRAIPTLDVDSSGRSIIECMPSNRSCAMDRDGHGTHCAGTVAGRTLGVAPNATIHAVKILNDDGKGTTAVLIAALDWVLKNAQKPAVISMSLGGKRHIMHRSTERAIKIAKKDGIPVVVAAGNEAKDACDFDPAYIPDAITVGSTDKIDETSWFSNQGRCVDIFAPGSNILSAGHYSDTDTTKKSGTSMACPHVTGAVALLLGQHPALNVDSISATLLAHASSNKISKLKDNKTPNKLLHVSNSSVVVVAQSLTKKIKFNLCVQVVLASILWLRRAT